jgi:signal recognition particle subunit SRP68
VESAPAEMTDGDRMQVDSTPKISNVSLEILSIINVGQREHGMRQRDYARYRQYCARRLARLYKTCKMKHGKGRYVKKPLDVNEITDERALLIPLTQSERAWAYAMEMKDCLSDAKKRKADLRQHLLRRMRKAVVHANELAAICAKVGSEQTALEGDAYANYIAGVSAVEQGKDYVVALQKLLRAKRAYDKLGLLGDQKRLELYRERVEAIDDLVNYAVYMQGKTVDVASMEEDAVKDLSSNTVFTMQVEGPPEIEDKIRWHAMDFELKNRDARVLIAQAQDCLQKLEALKNSTGHKANLLFAKAISFYDEARSKLNDEVAKENAKAQYQLDTDGEDKAERIKLTEIALSMIVKDKMIDRAKHVNDQLDKKLMGKAKKEKADKKLNFADLARMYDRATVDYEDLMETAPMLLRLKPDNPEQHTEEFEIDCEAEVMLLKAKQNLAIACHNMQLGNFKEADAYFGIATDLARDAEGRDCAGDIQDEATDLLKDIEDRIAKAKRKAEESGANDIEKSQSASDLTSQVTERLGKLFSFSLRGK